MMEDNAGSKLNMIGTEALANKDNAGKILFVLSMLHLTVFVPIYSRDVPISGVAFISECIMTLFIGTRNSKMKMYIPRIIVTKICHPTALINPQLV